MISLCMIAFNEGERIGRALANWRDLADELIVTIDSRTTDRTADIVQELGGTTINFEYIAPGHKGEARNIGLAAASGDWIVVLDADEEIADPATLRHYLLDHAGEVEAVNVTFENVLPGGGVSLRWQQCRIFRNGAARYIHREHELPVSERDLPLGQSPSVFRHYGNDAPGKNDAMLARLELDHRERPDDLHPLYFLSRQYLINQQPETAIDTLHKFIHHARAANSSRLADAYSHLGKAHELAGDISAAFEAQHMAIAWEPCRREFWTHLASMYRHYHGDHALALAYMQAALTIPAGRGIEQSPQAEQKLLAMWNHSQEMIHGRCND